MKHSQDEVIIYKEITTASYIFRLEEYWEEDDAGFCCVDYVLAKHTRLTVSDVGTGRLVKTYDFDSREYDKDMTLTPEGLIVTYQPEYNETMTVLIDPKNL